MEIKNLQELDNEIIKCKKCQRLAIYIQKIARGKVPRFSEEEYWGRPLTGFGDFKARLLIIGLAPAAHGGNRTGRMFTGDSSGDWVARVLYENGFATKATSSRLDDGFSLIDTYITAVVKCAPPQNKPLKEELENCSSYLRQELILLSQVQVIVCLGKISFDSCCKLLGIEGIKFSHGRIFTHQRYTIVCSYHPSRQNTQTGRLGWTQWFGIFTDAKKRLAEEKSGTQT